MGKPTLFEIIILFDRRYSAKDIISMGYKPQTVYAYKKRWLDSCEIIKGLKK